MEMYCSAAASICSHRWAVCALEGLIWNEWDVTLGLWNWHFKVSFVEYHHQLKLKSITTFNSTEEGKLESFLSWLFFPARSLDVQAETNPITALFIPVSLIIHVMYTYTPLVYCAVTEAIGKVVNGGTVCRWRILSVKCSDSCSRFISVFWSSVFVFCSVYLGAWRIQRLWHIISWYMLLLRRC